MMTTQGYIFTFYFDNYDYAQAAVKEGRPVDRPLSCKVIANDLEAAFLKVKQVFPAEKPHSCHGPERPFTPDGPVPQMDTIIL